MGFRRLAEALGLWGRSFSTSSLVIGGSAVTADSDMEPWLFVKYGQGACEQRLDEEFNDW